MGSKKEHKHKKEHKRHHKRKHKHSSSEERSSPSEKRKRVEDEERKDRKSRKHHKQDRRHHAHEGSPPSPESQNNKNTGEDIAVEEEEIYLPQVDEVKQEKVVNIKQETDIPTKSGTRSESLSIGETNRLREKLGLKPLKLNDSATAEDESKKPEFVHAPAEDGWKKKKELQLREKLQARKDKRAQEKKFAKIKTLGDGDDEESALSWVEKSRAQEVAVKKEKEMTELDKEFGVSDLVEKELGSKKKSKPSYTEKDLKGMNVEHSVESFKEGRNAVLVLKDKEILASDDEDVLHSLNIQDVEKAKKNLEIKRRGVGYKAYEEEEVDEMGFFKQKAVLGKYDEEIEGEKSNRFTIGARGKVDTSWEQQKESMKQEIRAKGESLALPALKLASEYLTEEEMKFKKRKRKVKKIRKRNTFKADDLLPLAGSVGGQDHGSRVKLEPGKIPGWDEGVEITKTEYNQAMEIDESNVIADEDDAIDELQRNLEKSRRAKQKTNVVEDQGALKVMKHIGTMSNIDIKKPEEQFSNTIYLNSTDEFCKQLGSLMPVKQEVSEVTTEVDMELEEDEEDEPSAVSQWNSVNPGEGEIPEKPINQNEVEEHAPIEAEPLAANGLMGALQLAKRKGYLQEESVKKGNTTVITNANSYLQAKNYSIEDKNAVDYLDKYAHEKYTKDRSRHDRGMVTDFVEKKDYKPKIAIEYVDDRGRVLSEKEAFRKLSHRFHGKASGKLKTEKRMKKVTEEDTMKHMSSTDTPLNTVAMMKAKQKTEASPYIVLSGAGKTLMVGGGASLAKNK